MDIFTSVCFRFIQFSNWQNISNMSNHSDTLQIAFHSGQHLFSSGRGHLNFPTWRGYLKILIWHLQIDTNHLCPSPEIDWPFQPTGWQPSSLLAPAYPAPGVEVSVGIETVVALSKCRVTLTWEDTDTQTGKGKSSTQKVPAGKGYLLVPRRAFPFPIEDTFKQNALIFYADILSWTSTCTGCVLLWRKPLSSSSVAMKSRISSTTCG